MSALSIHILPPWAMPIGLGVHVALGFVLGSLHFGGLWWNTRLFAEGGRATTALTVMLCRLVALAGVLTLVSFEGAGPLLATAIGLLLARAVVTRGLRGGPP